MSPLKSVAIDFLLLLPSFWIVIEKMADESKIFKRVLTYPWQEERAFNAVSFPFDFNWPAGALEHPLFAHLNI